MIVNVHRKDTPNRGDLASAPLRYFQSDQRIIYLDILAPKNSEKARGLCEQADFIIIGGGGLLDNLKFDGEINFLTSLYGKKVIVWGVGSNSVTSDCKTNLDSALFVGVRDFGVGRLWVPCASCLSPEFDFVASERSNFYVGGLGILENNSGAITAKVSDCGQAGIRRFGNKKVTMREMLEFIASCDVLVTSSFHAAFWATLLCVPVVAIPTSSKFQTLKHKVPLASPDDWTSKINETCVYLEALEECRNANMRFQSSLPTVISSMSLAGA